MKSRKPFAPATPPVCQASSVAPASDAREVFWCLTRSVASAAKAHDWDVAVVNARDAGAIAERLNDAELLYEAAKCLQRLEVFDRAWELFRACARIRWMAGKPEWDGQDLAGRTLLIRSADYQPGDLLRFARLTCHAVRHSRARHCIVLTEDKLIGLLQRNFPDVDFRVELRDHEAALAEADVVASFETLCTYFANDRSAIVRSFASLCPDLVVTSQFRKQYQRHGDRPLIGLSWWSSNTEKNIPTIEDWANFMGSVPATFVSLQYGDITAAVRHFIATVGDRLIVDTTVDPLGERDRFAAQVGALDGVVTIPQTCAHMAGALDVPMIVLLDDGFHLSWPQIHAETPWYPKTRLMRKRGRTWNEVLNAAAECLVQSEIMPEPHHRNFLRSPEDR